MKEYQVLAKIKSEEKNQKEEKGLIGSLIKWGKSKSKGGKKK